MKWNQCEKFFVSYIIVSDRHWRLFPQSLTLVKAPPPSGFVRGTEGSLFFYQKWYFTSVNIVLKFQLHRLLYTITFYEDSVYFQRNLPLKNYLAKLSFLHQTIKSLAPTWDAPDAVAVNNFGHRYAFLNPCDPGLHIIYHAKPVVLRLQ